MPGHSGGGHSGGGHMGGGHSSFGGGSHMGGSHSSHSSFGGRPRGGMGGPRPGGPMGGGPRPGPRPFFGGPRYYGGYYGPGYYGRRRRGFGSGLVIFLILMLCLPILVFSNIYHSMDDDYDYDYSYDNSYGQYTKLTPSEAYDTNNVIDNTNQVVNETVLSQDLKDVYDKTGIQPYILVVDNEDGSYDDEMEEYSNTYYDNNIDVENGFLITYYYSDDSNSYDVYYTLGYDTDDFVDNNFIDTFYSNLDDNWNDDSADQTEAFYEALTDTVDSLDIVDASDTGNDSAIDVTPDTTVKKESFFAKNKKLFIGLGACVAGIAAIVAINKNRKKKEEQDSADEMNQYYVDNSDDNDTYSSTK